MVTMFPLGYMHLCCLGVTRKLLIFWIRGKAHITRLSTQTVAEISQKLKLRSPYTPVEFSRKPRGLSEIDHWKATELHSFMLYTGPVVLQNCIHMQMYENVVVFCCYAFAFILWNPRGDD